MDALPANRSWQPSRSHGTYQHETITSRSRQLLMMGTWLPETCWAIVEEKQRTQKWHLVGFSYPHWITMHGQPHIKFTRSMSTPCYVRRFVVYLLFCVRFEGFASNILMEVKGLVKFNIVLCWCQPYTVNSTGWSDRGTVWLFQFGVTMISKVHCVPCRYNGVIEPASRFRYSGDIDLPFVSHNCANWCWKLSILSAVLYSLLWWYYYGATVYVCVCQSYFRGMCDCLSVCRAAYCLEGLSVT